MVETQAIMAAYNVNVDLFRLTQAAVDSIKKTGMELIIIDNGSTYCASYLSDVADIYVRVPKNLGYAPAMNMGLKLATSPLVAFVENDIVVSPNSLEVAKGILNTEMGVGSVHFPMLRYEGEFKYGDTTWLTGKERWCTFGFFVTKQAAIPKDLLDENYIGANYEDYDYIHRMRHLNGWKTAYTNKACYKHMDAYTQRLLDPTIRSKNSQHNFEYFKSKWGDEPDPLFQKKYPEQWQQDYLSGFYEDLNIDSNNS